MAARLNIRRSRYRCQIVCLAVRLCLRWCLLSNSRLVCATCFLQVPDALRSRGGKWRVCCKAFNINGDTQVPPEAQPASC
jgi:hypothetical protein